MTQKCPKCQTDNPDTKQFCGDCGTKLTPSEDVFPSLTKTLETPVEELKRGTLFAGRYEIIEELGKGGMGKVYRVDDTKLKQEIALKLVKPEIARDKMTIERFRNELKLARNIRHKNVCGMFDLSETEGAHFITMEYVRGEDLKSLVRRIGHLPIGKSISISKQICDGLLEAHRLGVVHRDLKSPNIMIDKDGNVRIMDFGIARLLTEKGITAEGVMIGTPEYMSPEQAEAKEVDKRTDIYSLGIILYEMITGCLPFEGDTHLAIAMKHKGEAPRNPKDLNPQIQDILCAVILKCMEKEKEIRYQNVTEVKAELEEIEQGLTTMESAIYSKKPETTKIPGMSWKYSVAVLPFADISPQKDQAYFCDGMTDDIITKLTKLQDLKVISRISVMRYKNTDKDIREIGQELSVNTILQGSVQKSGDYIRVNAQLINVEDGFHLWAETYDRELKNVFEIQSDLAENIAKALKTNLTIEEIQGLSKNPTNDLEAYNIYLMGRHFWNMRTEEGFQKSLEQFQKAIKKDPSYALAYTGIADYFNLIGYYDLVPPREAFPRAKKAAEKAIDLDETLAEAHTSLAFIQMCYEWDWTGTKSSFKRAIELNPSYVNAHNWYSAWLGAMGRNDESIATAKRALELDPTSLVVRCTLGSMFMFARRYDEEIEELHRAIELDPTSYIPHWYIVYPYAFKGLYDEAITHAQEALRLSGMSSRMKGVLGHAYAFSGKKTEAKKLLNELEKLSKTKYLSPFGLALVYIELDEKDKALDLLDKAYEEHDHWLYHIKVAGYLDKLRSEPKFKALLKKMRLE
jgi:serine/threonine protein kinase/Tfp pilus assembly protein PilF